MMKNSIDADALLTAKNVVLDTAAHSMCNGLITVKFRPDAGGRISQIQLGGHEFLWVNRQLEGASVPPAGIADDGGWINWGGEKIWPSPQGWSKGFFQNYCDFKGIMQTDWNDGPPMPEIDGMPWSFESAERFIKLESKKSTYYGISFQREVKIFDDTSRINILVKMENTDNTVHNWGIWTNSQLDPEGKDLLITAPINRQSIYPEGFSQQFGLVGTDQAQPDYENMLFNANFKNEVAKFGLDSDAGWLAVTDRGSGKVYVKTFSWFPDRQYPDNSSVEIWLNGAGDFYGFDRKIKLPEDETAFVEAELLGPVEELQPGESAQFIYNIYTTSIEPGRRVISVNPGGVCTGESSAENDSDKGGFILNASYGVFYKGEICFALIDRGGVCIAEIETDISVSPEKHVNITDYKICSDNYESISRIGVYISYTGGSRILVDQIEAG